MELFIYALIFIFFSTFVKIPGLEITIQILPAFIGYLILIFAIRKHKKTEPSFAEVEYLSIAMFFYTLIEFVSGLVEFDLMFKSEVVANLLYPITTIIIPLFITYRIIWSFRNLEFQNDLKLNTDLLTQLWAYLTILMIVNLILKDNVLTTIILVASLLVKAMIIYNLRKTIKIYKLSQ